MTANDQKIVDAMLLADNGYKYYEHWFVEYLEKTEVRGGTGRDSNDPASRRVVYERNGTYYKTWGREYKNRDNVFDALKVGFYKEVCKPLVGLIFDEEAYCRGYVMHKVKPWMNHRVLVAKMIDKLIEASNKTGFAFRDTIPANFAMYKKEIQVIDLETVIPIDAKTRTKDVRYNNAIDKWRKENL